MEIEQLTELSLLEYARYYNDQGLGWGFGDGTTRGAEARALIAKLIDDEIERQKPCDYCNVGEIIYQKDYKTATRTGWIKPNYCPNCGRQLRGDE